MIRLKQLRTDKKISQVKLALELNTTQASISKYEKGQVYPDINMLIEIAKYFHVSVDYLLELTPFKNFSTDTQFSNMDLKCLSLFNSLPNNKKSLAIAYLTGLKENQ